MTNEITKTAAATPAQQTAGKTGVLAPKMSIANFLAMPQTAKYLDDILKEKKSSFIANLIALTEADKGLALCDNSQLMKCALNATAVNLSLNKNLGHAYVIAYKGVPQFQIGYKGIIQLAIRTGQYKTLNACEVKEGEIKRNKFTGKLEFIGEYPQNKVIGYMAYLELNNGFTASVYMSEEEIEAHALRFSQAYRTDKKNGSMMSKWSDRDARPKMALKTVLKGLLSTYGLLSIEMQQAFETDSDSVEYTNTNRMSNAVMDTEAEIIPQDDPQQPATTTSEIGTLNTETGEIEFNDEKRVNV